MESDDPIELRLTPNVTEADVETIRAEIGEHTAPRRNRFAQKFFLAAISGIPWIGGYLSALAAMRGDEANSRVSELQTEWLEEHHGQIEELQETLSDVEVRFVSLGETITERIESEEYLYIVRKAFRVWDTADTKEKKDYVANLITNAGALDCVAMT